MSLSRARIALNNCRPLTPRLSLLRGKPARNHRKWLSTSEVEAVEEAVAKQAEEVNLVTRHGEGDGVITLNVGGKEFITLRSTIQNNPVLNARVKAAEANQEMTKGAVFIDRDPSYFHLILQHLRNRADMLQNPEYYANPKGFFSRNMPSSVKTAMAAKKKIFGKKDVLIQLPEKKEAQRDLWMEARYFRITELEALLCSNDWYTRIAQFFGSSSNNPFHAASEAITFARRALVTTSGIGVVLGAQNEQLMNNIKGFFTDLYAAVRGDPNDAKGGGRKKAKDSKNNSSEQDEAAFSFS